MVLKWKTATKMPIVAVTQYQRTSMTGSCSFKIVFVEYAGMMGGGGIITSLGFILPYLFDHFSTTLNETQF